MIKNILVIETDFEAGRAIARALETEGYFVFTASSADVGLLMAKRVKPALIILDPEPKGIEEQVSRKLRSIESLRNVPILLLSDGEKEYEHSYSEAFGIVNFIKKPVDLPELVAKSKASLEDLPSGHMERPVIKVRESTLWESGLLSHLKKEASAQAAFQSGPEDSPEKNPEDKIGMDNEEEKELFPAAEEPEGFIGGPPDEGDQTKEPEDPGQFTPDLMKKRHKKSGGRNFFLLAFILILALSAAFGYFFFFIPGEKAERVLQESPVVPEAAKQAREEGPVDANAPAPSAKVPESALPNTDQLFAKSEPQDLDRDIEKTSKPEKESVSTSEKEPRVFAVQLGVFGDRSNAERLVRKLNKQDYRAYIMETKKGKKKLYRVLVGKLSSEQDARVLSVRLHKDGFKPVRYFE